MARFTVRVELFGKADEDDYENLHGRMQKKRHFRVIQADSGKWYHLPSATYDHTNASSTSQVREEVWSIAKAVWSNLGVHITKSDERAWQGLREATATEVKNLTS